MITPRAAYFTMEIALQNDIPTYSGGLGVLSGDTIRSMADLDAPVVAVSLCHRKGYFTQKIVDGKQTEQPMTWDPGARLTEAGPRITVPIADRTVHLRAWHYPVQGAGGHIDGFMSYCGGLPAPEANDNPFGYKFSWSPRGVLLAARNAAHYLRDGQEVNVPGQELFTHYWPLDVEGLGQFEAFPNRDSLPYREVYGIDDAATMYRGTLRNKGWCDVLYKIAALGFLDDQPYEVSGMTYAQFVRGLLPPEVTQTSDVKADVAVHLGVERDSAVIKNLAWLGLFDERPVQAPGNKISPLDLMTQAMLERMQYAEGERDLIILVHHFDASYPDGKKEKISSTLIAFGEPGGDTAMARTVSLPAAIGVDLILRGEVTATGVQTPVTPDWYEPILAGLKELGIECVERVEAV